MKKLLVVLMTALTATFALAQGGEVTEAERAHAAMMVLSLVVGGMLLTFLLLYFLRKAGKLPEEKPVPKPLWEHPDDADGS